MTSSEHAARLWFITSLSQLSAGERAHLLTFETDAELEALLDVSRRVVSHEVTTQLEREKSRRWAWALTHDLARCADLGLIIE